MSKGIMLADPPRSDYRMILFCLKTYFKAKVIEDKEAFDRVARVFQKAGGSWERLFTGSGRDIDLLRKIVKIALKKKILQKAPNLK